MRRRSLLLMLGLALTGTGMSCAQRTPSTTIPVPKSGASVAETDSTPKETYKIKLETTKGNVIIEMRPDWAPIGAARVRELVEIGYYNDCAIFRVIPGFMAQFGMAGDPSVFGRWADNTLKDEPVRQSNTRGMVTFAKSGLPNSRSTQLFINYGDNRNLDADGFAPVGKVLEGMEVMESLFSGYGEAASSQQPEIKLQGNEFLRKNFPKLDYIKRATLIQPESATARAAESGEAAAAGSTEPAGQ